MSPRAGRSPLTPATCRGLSLVELMVAALLGLLISAAMISLYLGSKRQHLYDAQWARLQENGRYAIRLLSREIAMAGFYGGSLVSAEVEPASVAGDCGTEAWALDTRRPVALVNDHPEFQEVYTTDAIALNCLDGASLVPGSDALVIKRTAAEASLNAGVLAPGISMSSSPRWYLQRRERETPSWRRLRPSDLPSLAVPGETVSLWEAVSRIFYLRRYSDPRNSDDGTPALCMETLLGDGMSTRCLVEGVEDMQLELGIDSDGDGIANRFLSSPRADDLHRLVAARVYLLLRSLQPMVGYRHEQTYRLGAREVVAAKDGHLRRVFAATVRLRNPTAPIRIPRESLADGAG